MISTPPLQVRALNEQFENRKHELEEEYRCDLESKEAQVCHRIHPPSTVAVV